MEEFEKLKQSARQPWIVGALIGKTILIL